MPTKTQSAVLQLDSTQASSSTQVATKAALGHLGLRYESHTDFWKLLQAGKASEVPTSMVVIANMSRVARIFQSTGRADWAAGVRTAKPYVLSVVTSKADRAAAAPALIEQIVEDSDHRLTVCELRRPLATSLAQCLAKAAAAIRPEGVVAASYSDIDRTLWLMFGDGLRAKVPWSALGLDDRRPELRPETVRVAEDDPETLEVLDTKGDVFQIDAASLRSLADKDAGDVLKRSAVESAVALGRTLAEARQRAGLTQDELGARAGLTQEAVSRLEGGKHWPRIDTLRSYAHGLGISVRELLTSREEELPQLVKAPK
ncbi:MAG TPA: helix-turn-helix transcriptional regulator [Nitrospirales bacterium]|nr:helix-turn-helix transcriptional regulator [Nitrospirales bacterium]